MHWVSLLQAAHVTCWVMWTIGERSLPMEEVPPLPPPADPPPAIDPSSETVAMMLAPIHSYGHKEPFEVSRAEFESTVRDALEDFPTKEVVEDMTRELDMVKSFPMYQTLPQAEAPGTVWSGRWCCRREEPKQVRARFVVRPFATSLGAAFYSSTPGLEVMRVLFVTAPLKDIIV